VDNLIKRGIKQPSDGGRPGLKETKTYSTAGKGERNNPQKLKGVEHQTNYLRGEQATRGQRFKGGGGSELDFPAPHRPPKKKL